MEGSSIKDILSDKKLRMAYCEKDLYVFGIYYFTEAFKSRSADFHKQWSRDMMSGKHLEIIAFRESGKTLWAMIKVIHNIVYSFRKFIMFYCYDKRKAGSKLYDIVVQLQTNRKLINDFGELFPVSRNEDEATTKKSVLDFITRNNVKVKASSIGESPRGELFFTKSGAYRPDYIVLDDIDVDKSVSNIETIEKNYLWLKGELMGGISDEAQILFLGNIIKSDGIVPRFEKDYANSEYWIIRRKAIKENGVISWGERYNEDDLIKKKELLGEISYNQNYMLIPYSGGESIIKRHQIQYFDYDIQFSSIVIGIDPAISEKSKSDPFAITITGKIKEKYYVLESIELIGTDKDPFKAVLTIKGLYQKYRANYVRVETVAFQQVMSKLLKAEGLATREVKPHRDKVTRLMEWQYLFDQGNIYFKVGMCDKLINQLLSFPNLIHDDMVDSLVYSFEEKKKGFILDVL